MNGDYPPETVAMVIHAANRVTQVHDRDCQPAPPWSQCPREMRAWAIAGVRAARAWALTAEQSHERWRARLEGRGWTHGPVKDHTARTHPCLLPWDQLTPAQQQKDVLFVAIVRALTPSMAVAA